VRVLDGLVDAGVAAERLLPVVNRAPRSPRARAELTAAVAELAGGLRGGRRLASPVFVPERRRLDDAVRDGERLPAGLGQPVRTAVDAVLARLATVAAGVAEPVAVIPGSLGSWREP
jgi:hypothetical protein